MRFSALGFPVDALVRGGEDFGEIGELELGDEGEGDSPFIGLRPPFQPANKCLNHDKSFILEFRATLYSQVSQPLLERSVHHQSQRSRQPDKERPAIHPHRLGAGMAQPPRLHFSHILAISRSRWPKGFTKATNHTFLL